MLEISEIPVSISQGASEEGCLEAGRQEVMKLLGCQPFDIESIKLSRRSVDARRSRHVQFIISVHVQLRNGFDERGIVDGLSVQSLRRVRIVNEGSSSFPEPLGIAERQIVQPVIIGAGCAGLFAALALAEAGLEPLLIERGKDAEGRAADVRRFNDEGVLDPDSNVQFGLGGSNAYSGGRLAPSSGNPDHKLVLETFVQAGAPRDILWEAEPRIGSDVFPAVLSNIVARIEELGGEVRFSTKLTAIDLALDGSIRDIKVSGPERDETILTNRLILACGHSAHDVVDMLRGDGVELARKTFAMGVRIEHLQASIDQAQYGAHSSSWALGPASYELVTRCRNGRSLSTSCMCPAGCVVAAASEPGVVTTSGAFMRGQTGRNASSALLVNINPEDLEGDDPLAGLELRQRCEERAFELGGGDHKAPVQLVGNFLAGNPSTGPGRIKPTYRRGVTWTDLEDALPPHVVETLRLGIPQLDRRLRGFNNPEAVLTGVETRSSSPFTIVRGKDYQAVSTPGLYPCGEGSGYATGVMDAAADGLNCARALIDNLPSYLVRRNS